ncbi:MAG: O-antigen translocase [Bacteroidota bacterium]
MNSSKSILKATSLIGGSQVLNIIINLAKSKIIAILLGPTGTGLISALVSSTTLVESIAGLGINNSAVREIAKNKTSKDPQKLNDTILTLRRLMVFTGLLGMVLTFILAETLSIFTFNSDQYTFEIRILSIAVFFNIVQTGHAASIQGMGKIKQLAVMSITSTALGALFSMPLIYIFSFDGIPLFLTAAAIGQYLVALYFARKIDIQKVVIDLTRFYDHAKGMIRLGVAFMGATLINLLSIYLIRVCIIRFYSLEEAGLYQAAFAISGLFINIVLQAMAKDFYPRLAEVSGDSTKEIKLINEQIGIGMMLAAPGLLFTLALAPIAIRIFYSAEYLDAYTILQWMIIGVFFRTVSWPMGYLFVARAKGKIFFLLQLASALIHIALVTLFLKLFGVQGTGIAFFGMYFIHIGYLYLLVNKENLFKWSPEVKKWIVALSLLFMTSLFILNFTSDWIGGIIISIFGLITTVFTLKRVMSIMKVETLKELIQYLKGKAS